VPTESLALDPCECKNGGSGGVVPMHDRGPVPRGGPGLWPVLEGGSGGGDSVGLRTLGALDDLEVDPLALFE
jgi:hypothetical protein